MISYNRASADLVDRFALHEKAGVELGATTHWAPRPCSGSAVLDAVAETVMVGRALRRPDFAIAGAGQWHGSKSAHIA